MMYISEFFQLFPIIVYERCIKSHGVFRHIQRLLLELNQRDSVIFLRLAFNCHWDGCPWSCCSPGVHHSTSCCHAHESKRIQDVVQHVQFGVSLLLYLFNFSHVSPSTSMGSKSSTPGSTDPISYVISPIGATGSTKLTEGSRSLKCISPILFEETRLPSSAADTYSALCPSNSSKVRQAPRCSEVRQHLDKYPRLQNQSRHSA